MDKYEYRVRAEEINALIERKAYAEAVEIADTIDWRRVKSVLMLCKISDLYKINRRYEDSKEILLLANEKHPGNRKIVYSLCELSIKLEEIVEAVEYYKEFVQVAPKDTGRYILQYRLYEAQDVSLEERIAVLEEYKKRDYREKWAYELAYLYHRIGLATRCVEECDELILWFGEGRYIIKAMELKMLHEPLTPAQQEKYDRRNRRSVIVEEETTTDNDKMQSSEDLQDQIAKVAAMTLPISIKSVEVTNAPTAKIPAKKVQDEILESESDAKEEESPDLEEDTFVNEPENEEISEVQTNESEEETKQSESDEEASNESEDDEMDIQIKPIDMGEYNTINLQQELAKNLANLLAEEDMEANDATKVLPIDTIIESTNPELLKGVTTDKIKDAIVAPLLQDTAEMTPITEEDLLASLDEKPKTVDELVKEEEEAKQKEQELVAKTMEIPEVSSTKEIPAIDTEKARIQQMLAKKEEALEEAVVQEAPIVEEVQPEEAPVVEEVQPEEVPVVEEVRPEEATEDPMVDKQITGQLSFTDIMAEWEETKKANEEKHREEMRQRVLKQTGPMFADFDAAARESVSSQFDLISPMEDVFKESEDLAKEVQNALDTDLLEKQSMETPINQESDKEATPESRLWEGLDQPPVEEKWKEDDSVKTKIFNTAEIRGIEEKLLSNLQKESQVVEPELVTPVIPETEELPILPETVSESKDDSIQLESKQQTEESSSEVSNVDETTKSTEDPLVLPETGEIQFTDLVLDAKEPEKEQTPVVSMDEAKPEQRELNKQEKEVFGSFAQTKKMENQIARAIDLISLDAAQGNVLISGEPGSGAVSISKNLIKIVQATNPQFSHKVAKITGSILDKKDIRATLTGLENGALIVEKAGDLTPHVCETITQYLNSLPKDKGFVMFLEDTKANIDKLTGAYPQMLGTFNIQIDIDSLDNDGLVNYGKEYAKEQDYSIDDMGMLALYTRISDMQTNDHHVTVDEVKSIVDEAIEKAAKKSVSHFVDVLLAKRYDSDDMIVLREKDFLKDR